MKNVVSTILLTLAATGVQAQSSLALAVHGVSFHTASRQSGLPWNSLNAGVGIRFTPSIETPMSYQIGGYRDSVFQPTIYAMADYLPIEVGYFQAGAFGGLKQSRTTALRPIGGLVLRLKNAPLAIALRIAPAPQSHGVVFALETSFAF